MKFELSSLPRNCSDEELIDEIKRVDSILEKEVIKQKDFNNFSKISAQSIAKRFGTWEQALISSGLGHKYYGTTVTKKMRQQTKKLTNHEILES